MTLNIEEIEHELIAKREDIIKRMQFLQMDKRRIEEPLTQDFDDQVASVENDQVIDGLDEMTRSQLASINEALDRIHNGQYGICINCGEQISEKRMHALPYVLTCINCANEASLQ